MRRATIGLALALAVLGAPACKRKLGSRATDEGKPARMYSVVAMSNPRLAGQLITGFHGLEAGAWRWTERLFSISLAKPPHADQRGAVLSVTLTIPPVTIEKLKSITLAGNIAGAALDPETYTAPGNYVYKRPVPAGALAVDPVRVDFSLDKVIPPTGADLRELGIVVLAIGLQSQ